ITPPQQALNWIPDLYGSVSELRARGHVIIYTLHDSIGHLGIFVSANVASKQHKQIASVVKTIEALAPGLYEMIIEENDGAFTVDFQARTIDDILALDDGREEEEEFAAVSQVSEWATRTYEMTVRPIVKAMVTPGSAEFLKRSHPMRVQRYMFTRDNPLMKDIDGLADRVREKRIPAAPDNPFLKLERFAADAIEANWNLYRDMRDAMTEMMFHGIYATPWMRALAREGNKPAEHRDASQLPQVRTALAKAKQGGYAEAIVRMLILLAAARGSVRRERLERSDKLLHSRPPFDTMPQEHRTQLIHEQSMIVEFAPQEALSTLPDLLHDDVDRIRAVNFVMDVAGPVDEMNAPTIAMFKKIQAVLLTVPHDWNEPKHEISAHEPGQHPSVATPNKAKGASRSKRRGKQGVANGQGK
ncbi:MAG: DUF3141 domain-containing protein, partial [Novosphingobium sp.]|nr:DUF3141 domain-containing protein [Novosphingobium sp.]